VAKKPSDRFDVEFYRMLDGGPTRRLSKTEQEEARRYWLEKQQHRRWLESEIAKRGQLTEADLDELGLTIPDNPPAWKFITDCLAKVRPDDPQFNKKWQQAVIDLVASDVPLDPIMRHLIAGELRRLYFPNAERDRRERRRLEIAAIESQKQLLQGRGMTAKEVEQAIAENFGISVDGLRKKIQREGRWVFSRTTF
jgi:hypothetical protein